jgi:hypothetical protein
MVVPCCIPVPGDDLIDDLELEGNLQLHVLDIIRRDDSDLFGYT